MRKKDLGRSSTTFVYHFCFPVGCFRDNGIEIVVEKEQKTTSELDQKLGSSDRGALIVKPHPEASHVHQGYKYNVSGRED